MEQFIAAAEARSADARLAGAYSDLRSRFAHVPGPHPLDADSTDLALFAVGWKLLIRDLSVGLSSEDAETVERVLVAHGVTGAFVLRDNLVNYKKVLLGIFRDAGIVHRDLRRQIGRAHV